MNCSSHPEKPAAGICVMCGKLFCADCLMEIDGKMYCRNDIGKMMGSRKGKNEPGSFSGVMLQASAQPGAVFVGHRYKKKATALVFAVFLGWLGVHRFYVDKTGTGLLWALSCGCFFIGWIIDVILIATGSFTDKAGFELQ